MSKKGKKSLIFFYHKNHKDRFNGTSVYDNVLLDILSNEYNITSVEPGNGCLNGAASSGILPHYFVHLIKNVYAKQLRWLISTMNGKHHIPRKDTIFLVEDVYSAPIPLMISKLKGYKFVYRAADFGKSYSKTLFKHHRIDTLLYSILRGLAEKVIVRHASLIICPSDRVRNDIVAEYPKIESKIVIMPFVPRIGENRLMPRAAKVDLKEFTNKVKVLYIGDFRYPPNRDAGEYIVKHLAPHLTQYSDKVAVLIAGPFSNAIGTVKNSGVRLLGPVDDLDHLLSESQIGIAPIETIGGLSMKIVDYLTHGMRVIATPEAAAGIVKNSQMRVTGLPDFHDVLAQEIDLIMKNGHESQKICKEVQDTYLSDRWQENLLRTLRKLGNT